MTNLKMIKKLNLLEKVMIHELMQLKWL